MACRVLLCGVGGQGTILAAHILADVAMAQGQDVKVSEIHGMAQRGGSVTTVVTFGESVESMVSGVGESDVLVSFDMLEALRNLNQVKRKGTFIVNDEMIKPASVLTGRLQPPQNMTDALDSVGALLVPATSTAVEAGNVKTANVVLLGALSSVFDFPETAWHEQIKRHVPAKALEVNLKAFALGHDFAVKHAGN